MYYSVIDSILAGDPLTEHEIKVFSGQYKKSTDNTKPVVKGRPVEIIDDIKTNRNTPSPLQRLIESIKAFIKNLFSSYEQARSTRADVEKISSEREEAIRTLRDKVVMHIWGRLPSLSFEMRLHLYKACQKTINYKLDYIECTIGREVRRIGIEDLHACRLT